MMADATEVGKQKRRCNRCVLVGLALMLVGLLGSGSRLAPELLATAAAVVGFGHLMYGVHLGWQVFYDRESDGPAS